MLKFVCKVILLPGTLICRAFGFDPNQELGLMRSYLNMLVWLPLGLMVTLLFVDLG